MAKQKSEPIITHVDIYARAIRNVQDEIKTWEDRSEKIPPEQRAEVLDQATAHLRPKLDALKELYRIESGRDYE